MRRYIVNGQHVSANKKVLSREFRKEMTPVERILWQRLRRNALNGFHFRREQVIDGYIVDFYCHDAGLVVEVDGAVHLKQIAYDKERRAAFERRELRELRFTNDEVKRDIESVLRRIELHLSPQPPPLRGEGEPEL